MNRVKIAIFASGAGSNAQKIIEHFRGHDHINIAAIFTNKPDAGVVQIGTDAGIEVIVFDKTMFLNADFVKNFLHPLGVTHIVLAGFLWMVPPYLIAAYEHRILNIHPALLPAYGGKGMFGIHVHQAVHDNKEKQTGITIHEVDEKYDNGKIIAQFITPLNGNETPGEIEKKVRLLEHTHFAHTIEQWLSSPSPHSF